MLVPTYPGVFIDESAMNAAFISNSPSCVPVIVIAGPGPSKRTAKLNSLKEYLGNEAFSSSDPTHVALRAYFENGGGPCYLSTADGLQDVIASAPDATLIVAAGNDISSQATKSFLEDNRLFAIFDATPSGRTGAPSLEPDSVSGADVAAKASKKAAAGSPQPDHPFAALYYPYLRSMWNDDRQSLRSVPTEVLVPPTAAVAGVYCSVDRNRGVWTTPANVSLTNLVPTVAIGNAENADLMAKGINPIRNLVGRTAVVWGARTASTSPDVWRYISVRRFFLSVERDISRSLEAFVFRPNGQQTWELARGAIENYLRNIWRQGGLMGSREEEAFSVSVGLNVTMTQDDIDQGRMIVKVGLAALRPAEFIILQFSHLIEPG